jgi:septum formation protein
VKLILASASSARQQMLSSAGYEFEIEPAELDEQQLKQDFLNAGKPFTELAAHLAQHKARTIGATDPDSYVIGSDQILACEGEVFSKVASMGEAEVQLQKLHGRTHSLISAVSVFQDNKNIFELSDTARLTMHRLDSEEINRYLMAVGDGILGSVGCYQIEAKGIQLFEKIEGSHFTIMGMPLVPLIGFLRTKSLQEL